MNKFAVFDILDLANKTATFFLYYLLVVRVRFELSETLEAQNLSHSSITILVSSIIGILIRGFRLFPLLW